MSKEQFDFIYIIYLLSCLELDEKIDTTLMSVRYILRFNQETISLALHKDWKQVTASLAQSKGSKIHLPAPIKLTS